MPYQKLAIALKAIGIPEKLSHGQQSPDASTSTSTSTSTAIS
jgi:hypothetical protein